MSSVEEAKKKAACAAVDENVVRNGMVVGVGSGSTVVYAVERLAAKARAEQWRLTCVPTSFQATQLINANSDVLDLSDCGRSPVIDVAIDGADEVDAQLNCIKGGGACHLQEKLVAACARRFVLIADYRKNSAKLGEQWKKGVPVEVVPAAVAAVTRWLQALGGVATLRMGVNKAGPVVTDNGNLVLDADFGVIENDDVATLAARVVALPGVVEQGIFVRMAAKAYFGNADGTVTTRENASNRASPVDASSE
jgi:ribose 5-phosphate isomerase A